MPWANNVCVDTLWHKFACFESNVIATKKNSSCYFLRELTSIKSKAGKCFFCKIKSLKLKCQGWLILASLGFTYGLPHVLEHFCKGRSMPKCSLSDNIVFSVNNGQNCTFMSFLLFLVHVFLVHVFLVHVFPAFFCTCFCLCRQTFPFWMFSSLFTIIRVQRFVKFMFTFIMLWLGEVQTPINNSTRSTPSNKTKITYFNTADKLFFLFTFCLFYMVKQKILYSDSPHFSRLLVKCSWVLS